MNLTERIESVILSNLQPPEQRKIGVECECFFYDKNLTRIPVNSAESYSATDLLKEMISLQSNDEIKSGYSLEPGGQLEWASSPMKSLHEINIGYKKHKERVLKIVKRENLKMAKYSLEPLYEPSDIALIDNEKYRLMDKMFIKTGELGQWMMRNTSSIQINIDFSSKEEAEKMAYIADCVSPLASILFANSPFWKGTVAGENNLRYQIWNNTDSSRCGDLVDHGITNKNEIVRKYAQYVQTVPAIFVEDVNGDAIKYRGTLGSWLGELFDNKQLTDRHIQIALHQIFTNVRFKNVLEVRGSDRPPANFELAPAAFWVGLLHENRTQDEIYNLVEKWTIVDRNKLKLSAHTLDLTQTGPNNISIGEWIKTICGLSLNGLVKRNRKDGKNNESVFLKDYLNVFFEQGIPSLFIQKIFNESRKSIKDFI